MTKEAAGFARAHGGAIIAVAVTMFGQFIVGLVALGMILQQVGDLNSQMAKANAKQDVLGADVAFIKGQIAGLPARVSLN